MELRQPPEAVPNDAAGTNAFLAAHATPVEINAAHATPAAHRDLWIKAILRIVGPITGPEARDLRVVHELVRLSTMWGIVLQHRDPGGFPDQPMARGAGARGTCLSKVDGHDC